MGFTAANPVTVDEATKKDDYDDVFDNTTALKERRGQISLGGDYEAGVDNTTFVPIPGVVHAEIDGTNLSGFTVEVHVMCSVVSGTGTFDLYNLTETAPVASSETTFTGGGDRVKSSSITLDSATKEYYLRVKGSAASTLPRIWDAQIVIR